MVHLVVHLATEAKLGGPVCYGSMWFVERYLCELKSYVRNKAHSEGCIAEAAVAAECMTFCSRFLDGFETKHNQLPRNDDTYEPFEHSSDQHRSNLFPHNGGKPLGIPGTYILQGITKIQAHRYVLFNCSDINNYLRAHADEIRDKYPPRQVTQKFIERKQNEKFHQWLKTYKTNLERENGADSIEEDIRYLARGPIPVAKTFRAFNIRGFRFRPKRLDGVTQNSGVMLTAKTSSYATADDPFRFWEMSFIMGE